MMKQHYKVLVLLTTYNGSRFVEDQINSILSQTNVDIQLKISDDNSTDGTKHIVSHYLVRENVSFTINNPGSGSAANNFVSQVKTMPSFEGFDYVAFSDQDDIWLPEKMTAAIDMLISENAMLYCSNLTKWNNSDNTYSILKKDFPQKKFDYLFEGGSAGCTYVFNRELALQLQVFLKELDASDWKGFSHDWLVYFFARSRKHKVIIDSQSYIHYRIHDANVHGHLNQISLSTIKHKVSEIFSGYYQNHAVNYIKYVDISSEEYKIYNYFLGNYFQRNYMIWKYNFQLMRDSKKFMIFALLNLLNFR